MIAFKCISALAVLSVASAGHSAHNYNQYNTGYNAANPGYNSNAGFNNNAGPYNSAYSGNLGGAHIPILSYENVNNGDGTYRYSYETGNGISAHEQGAPRAQGPEGPAVTADGGFSYTAPDGQKISVAYTADENGFHPTGSHIPTPPPIPEAILKSLEFNRQHPASGEGAYNGGGHHGNYY